MLWLRPRSFRPGLRTVLVSVCSAVVGLAMPLASLNTANAQKSPVVDGEKNAAAETEWPQFLGPNRNGISRETGLIDRWPAEGPRELFRVSAGVGMSGMAISRGCLVTMAQDADGQRVIALDAASGKGLWQQMVAPEYRNPMGDGPRGTPAIAAGQVFAFTGEGMLVALDFETGKIQWSQRPLGLLGGKPAEYGMACSPLVVGDRVIVSVGAQQGTLVAFDTKSGKVVWKVGADPAGYSSPALLTLGGKKQLVAMTGASAVGVDVDSGKLLWRYPFETNFECNIATPLEHKGQLFLSAGENHGSVLLAVKSAGGQAKADQYELEAVWESFGPQSVLRNEWQTSILLDGYLYGMDNVGGAGPITHLTCIEAATGKRVWQVPRFGKGNLIAADGKLFMSTMKGELVVARANPERYDELGRATVVGMTRQAPALSGGRLYLRDDQEIVCLDVRKP
ncbi:MAG: Quinohemoprotein alcohol dehydrogenase precursor [Planctomycetota bacterium]